MNNIPLDDQPPTLVSLPTNASEHHKSAVRFWQGVALSLAIFALSLLASLVLGLGVLLLSR
jgi:ABC-type amino acid transport system permease subunit